MLCMREILSRINIDSPCTLTGSQSEPALGMTPGGRVVQTGVQGFLTSLLQQNRQPKIAENVDAFSTWTRWFSNIHIPLGFVQLLVHFAACMDDETQKSSDALSGTRLLGGQRCTSLAFLFATKQATDCSWPSPLTSLCWIKEMSVLWKESEAVEELEL
ncbi:hypothetical protein PoB_007273600 [Plakobranchus ocellatus]|uniref:Uncharacterized protein n=1 Tax=Plakobranchus ocellatus TaxID=259542 RepID=A0AAV4DQT9_9GAST|nr:hypothetical protein PoB_007273600 [Plakobranchus ocellatus]